MTRSDVVQFRTWVTVVLIAVSLGAATVLALPFLMGPFAPHAYAGTVLAGSEPAPGLDGLRFTSGVPVDPAAMEGDVVLIYFGYTYCPDECPSTMAAVARAVDALDEEQRARTRVIMVTVDNARDDADSLGRYVEAFDPSFRGALGPDEVTSRVASLYGVFFQARAEGGDAGGEGAGPDGGTDGGYTVDHTTSLVGIGPDGALRVVWPPNVRADDLAADIGALLS